MKGRRLLVLTPWWPTARRPWFGTFIRNQADAFREIGCDPVIRVCHGWWKPVRPVPDRAGAVPKTLSLPLLPRYVGAPATWKNAGTWVSRSLRGTPADAAIIHTEVLAAIAGPSLAVRGTRYLVVLHGEDTNPGPLATPERRSAIAAALEHAAAVVLVGRTLLPLMERLAPRARGVVVENGFDPEIAEVVDVRTPFQKGSPLKLSCVANLQGEKGQAELLGAMEILAGEGREAFLDLVGDGPLLADLRRLVSKCGLEQRVVFHGALPPLRAAGVIASSDAFVLPSRREALGIVYLNAMALGRPVVGVRGTGIDGVVEHGKTGYLARDGSARAVADVIRHLIEQPENARAVGAAGRVAAEARSWRENARKTIEILQETSAVA